MNLLKLIFKLTVVAILAVVAFTVLGKVKQKQQIADARYQSAAGFHLLQRNLDQNQKVWVMAPLNCPSREAQEARALCESIQAAGIPCEISAALHLNIPTNMDDAARVSKFMQEAGNPLVIVRGWGKYRPTLEDVIAQYQSGK